MLLSVFYWYIIDWLTDWFAAFLLPALCWCRVITLSNGLKALLISDQQSEAHNTHNTHDLDPNLLQNGVSPADAKPAVSSCIQEQTSKKAQGADVDDAGIIESDDEDTSWTDMSSDGDTSGSSLQDSASDSASSSKRIGGKKRSQHNHSTANVHVCGGEKLVKIVYSGLSQVFYSWQEYVENCCNFSCF